MRKVNGTGNKVNMDADIMLIGKETLGNKISALYTLNKNGVRRRITRSEFMQLASRGKIINCKHNGTSLVGLEESLRNIPIYDKKTGMQKNNVSEEQVIMSVNQKLTKNKLNISAKLKYNNTIVGYIINNEDGEEKRITRETAYRLVRQGFLAEYTAKIYNGIHYIFGGNISSLPEIQVDSQGRNISNNKDTNEISQDTYNMQAELNMRQHTEQNESLSSEQDIPKKEIIAKQLQEEISKAESKKQEELYRMEQERKSRQNKKEENINSLISRLGNTSIELKNEVQLYFFNYNTEINEQTVGHILKSKIHKCNNYLAAKELLNKYKKEYIKASDITNILTELSQISYNLYDMTMEEVNNIVIEKVAEVVSEIKLKTVIVDIDNSGNIILDSIILESKGKILNIKKEDMSSELLVKSQKEIKHMTLCKIMHSNIRKYKLNLYLLNYRKLANNVANAILDALFDYLIKLESKYISMKSINSRIDRLVNTINTSMNNEIQVVKDILSLTVICPYEIKRLSQRLMDKSFNNWDWKDIVRTVNNLTIKISCNNSKDLVSEWKIKDLDHCSVVIINNNIIVAPDELNIVQFIAVLMIHFQIVEQSGVCVEAKYSGMLSGYTLEWLEYGNDTLAFRTEIQNCSDTNDITQILRGHGFDISIINDIKEIKAILKTY